MDNDTLTSATTIQNANQYQFKKYQYDKYKQINYISNPQVINTNTFEIGNRFKVIELLGSGSYGVVVSAIDLQSASDQAGQNQNSSYLIAIKKIFRTFEHTIYAKRCLRELKIQRLLKHDNILQVDHIFLPESRESLNDIYVFGQAMDTDLGQLIRSPQVITEQHIQFFLYQILRGMKYMHSAKILHRDLKPRNLLINTNCDLKICDFGLARPNIPELLAHNQGKMTEYVITRWYRAPELLLSVQEVDYTEAVDVWSIGCIFAELMLRRPVFKGTDTQSQLNNIFNVIGSPTKEECSQVPGQEGRNFLERTNKQPPQDLFNLFQNFSPSAIDLLQKMLAFDHKKRITVDQALKHPFMSRYHCEQDEPVYTGKIPSQDFEFELYNKLTLDQYKDLIYEEILIHNFACFRDQYMMKIKNGQSTQNHIIFNQDQSPDSLMD